MSGNNQDFETTLTEEQKKLFFDIKSELQRAFAIELIANNFANQKDAYIQGCKRINKAPAKNPDKAACVMVKNGKVQAFLDSIRARKETPELDQAIGSFDQKRQILWETIQRCAQNVKPLHNLDGSPRLTEDKDGEIAQAFTFDSKGLVSAVAELNKMDGDHAAQRIELGASDDLVAAIYAGRRRTNREKDD